MTSALPEQAVADRKSQVSIVLPDGSRRTFEHAVTGTELAASIGPGLAKAAVAMEVDGALWDLSRQLPDGASVRFVRFQDDEALPLIRHDAAHLMAEAVKELWPATQVTIGPAIEDGFYYDFARDEPFTPDDLEAIEARMREIVQRDEPLEREVWERDKAVAFFEGLGERYKAELIAAIPEGEPITTYRQGEFIDLCRGPHMPSTGRMGSVQAPEGRRRLLAGRQPQPDAAADLRHRLGEPEAARRLPAPDRGGGAARSPPPRPPARLVPLSGGGGGLRLLAPQGLGDLPHHRELSAPPAGAGRLRGDPRRRS